MHCFSLDQTFAEICFFLFIQDQYNFHVCLINMMTHQADILAQLDIKTEKC